MSVRTTPDLTALSDDALLRRLSELLRQSRRVEAELVAHLAEVDARRLWAREAASSLFAYCTEILHLSEPEAYLRIAVARASRRHPVLLEMLADGRLHLSAIERLAPHLTEKNCATVLKRAEHKSKRQIEVLVAELAPRPEAPATIRKLPEPKGARVSGDLAGALELRAAGVTPTTAAPNAAGALDRDPCPTGAVRTDQELRPDGVTGSARIADQRPVVEPIGPARFRVRFDASAELRDKLERLQALMRSSVPDGDLARIIEAAVTEKLERLEARRFAGTKAPRKLLAQVDMSPRSRHIPAPVRRMVEKRDGGRCTYRDTQGRRCTRRHDLEFHHRSPFGRGGHHSPENLALMCRAHNALMAEHDYGKAVIARFRRSAGRVSGPVAVSGAEGAGGAVHPSGHLPG